jgi:hypothetical protein
MDERHRMDELAKEMTAGAVITRGRMLRLVGAALLVGITPAVLLPGFAQAKKRRKKKHHGSKPSMSPVPPSPPCTPIPVLGICLPIPSI